MNDLIIEVKHGGLGDHLFHSHLPRIAKETGAYGRVFYSLLSVVRNHEIIDLIWKLNPFVDGFVDARGTTLSGGTIRKREGNLLDVVMLKYGIDDGLQYHEPELFLDVQPVEALKDVVVYDPNYVSFVGAVDVSFITEHFRREHPDTIRQLEPRKRSYPLEFPVRSIRTNSLREYCQIIMSCREFNCLTSGSATLAAALKKPSTAFYGFGQNPIFRHSRQHIYVLASSDNWSTRARAIFLRIRRKLIPERLFF